MKKINHSQLLGTVCLIIVGTLLPLHAFALSKLFDGGTTVKMESLCSCSGGQTVRVKSVVDMSSHVYLYQPGATQLFMNYSIVASGKFFLTTLVPFAICTDESEDCAGSAGQPPEGIFILTGTSFNFNKDGALALLKQIPGADVMSQTFSKITSDLSWYNQKL